MWKALNATGRPILYSLSNWGEDYVHTVSLLFLSQEWLKCVRELGINSEANEQYSGECLLQIHGECLATYMMRSLDQTHFAVVTMQKIRIVLHQVGLHALPCTFPTC